MNKVMKYSPEVRERAVRLVFEQEGSTTRSPATQGDEAPGRFPTPDSVRKVLYLAIMKASERWSRPVQDWSAALNHLSIVFEGRLPV
jgi:hypothetical protein